MKIELEISLEKNTLDVLSKLVEVLPIKATAAKSNTKAKTATVTASSEVVEELAKKEVKAPVAQKEEPKQTPVEETSEDETTYTADDVRTALAEAKHRVGSSTGCHAILEEFGVKKVSDLKPSDFKAVIEKAKAL